MKSIPYKFLFGTTCISLSIAFFMQDRQFKKSKLNMENFIEKNQYDLYLNAFKTVNEFFQQKEHHDTFSKLFQLDQEEAKNLSILTINEKFSKHLMKFTIEQFGFPKICYMDETKDYKEVKNCSIRSAYQKTEVNFLFPIGNYEKGLIYGGLKVKMVSGQEKLKSEPKFFIIGITFFEPLQIFEKWMIENKKKISEWKYKEKEIIIEETDVINNHIAPEKGFFYDKFQSNILELPISFNQK